MQLRLSEHNQWFASVRIVGARTEQIELLVDTGAKFVHLDEKKCRELGLQHNGARGVPCIHGDIKSRNKYKGRIEIDDIHYSKGDIDIVGLIFEGELKPNLIGVIGQDVLLDLSLMTRGREQCIIENRN